MRKKAKKTIAKRAPQERGIRTRENLLQAAIQCLAESNLSGLRYSQIAKTAQVPQPLMDYHFPSLEALLTEMIHYQLEKLKMLSLEAIEANSTKPRKALEGYIRAPFQMCDKDLGFRAVWSSYYHLATINKSFGDFNRAVRKTGRERITSLIQAVLEQEQRQNQNRSKLVQEVANSIQGIITGHGFMAAAETEGNFKEMADLAVKASFQLLEANFPSQS